MKASAVIAAVLGAACVCGLPAKAQAPPSDLCTDDAPAPFCQAVRGDRAEGWLAQSRSEVMAQHGMVVTSQPLAAQAGLQILREGGNAVDAAVATAAVLNVVEPMMTGLAGDLFVVVYVASENKVYVLNSSGMAPSGATLAHLEQLGYHRDPRNWGPGSGMPVHGILPVTVPGALWGWEEVLHRFGKLGFREVLQPAIGYAEQGFPVSERIASDWKLPDALPLEHCCTRPDPDSISTWYIEGRAPRAGEIFRNPGLARTFRLLQQGGRAVFYQGEVARAILAKSQALGGTMTAADLAAYHGEWMQPARISFHGYELFELPPPSQAWAALEMLSILDHCVPLWTHGRTLASLGPANPEYWHLMVEAKKLAYADLYARNADPDFVPVPLADLLSSEHAGALCARVSPTRASVPRASAPLEGRGDTIVLSTADSHGNMVAWVNSNYDEFGSGITVPGYGFVLHDRGALFSLDPASPNVIAPNKRPFNTLSAGFVMRANRPFMTVTLMGGDMQAQGHAQLLEDVLELGANPQAAADMARFRHSQIPNTLQLESPLYERVGAALRAMGHHVRAANGQDMGGVQVIEYQAPGVYRSGSDPRKDGEAVGW
ncbi:MAG TPA: gamma-glutamyltransferase family protein [Steroidobacteraceae bacterium]|nr:gamma-glutamyltransferase family protein [Steroidobacteraceae bacterium]